MVEQFQIETCQTWRDIYQYYTPYISNYQHNLFIRFLYLFKFVTDYSFLELLEQIQRFLTRIKYTNLYLLC